ncbi:uncharacterized protein LOC8287386 isoform X2 [Ricinus communis]|uniref:uncharacterized protein LOC8287386 isoform X2 n=1 Tax=Ricinus communis TaxID=3988 RepID=UPI0007722EDC|nr:uncharacterized protein LOC8287386 isoform X2 [Ricinus communis]|eukprot:XP_015570606.1 uncharacterized protein LOC8287386 isoform X2 [Ricinus communis]
MAKKSPKSDMTQTSMSKSPLPKSPVVKTSISKSSMPKSPMQKSPMPNSPMQKSPIYEKYKSRCAYGFFNFLRRRSKKLIADADRRRISRHALGDGCVKSGLNLHSDQCIDDEVEEKSLAVDSGNLKKNKIKGEDVSIKQQMKKKITTAKVEYVQSTSELVHDLSRNQRKATKTARKARRLPIYGCYDVSTVGNINSTDQSLADRSSKSLDSAVTAEVLPNQVSAKNEGDGICRSTNTVQCDQFNEINLQVNMSKATEAFINQKLIDGKHLCGGGVSHQSKHFLDALEILNSNKDLFIKLLQDPNSLLVKHIEDLRDCQVKDQQSEPFAKAVPEHQTINARESNLSKTKEISVHQPFENIVVLRPNRISHDSQIHCSLRNVQQSVKPAFFPFEQIKRKLMQTIGIRRKEKQLMLTDGAVHHKSTHDSGFDGCGKRTGVKIFTTNSPYKASYDFGGITTSSTTIKRKDRMNKVNEFDPGISEEAASANESGHEKTCLSTLRHPERNKHDENVKSRINISELRNGNKNFLKKQRAKSGDAISSVREYDFFPTVSSRGTREHDSVSPQMRFSAHSSHPTGDDSNRMNQKEYKKSCLSPPRQNQEAPPWAVNKKQLQTYEKISDNILYDVQEHIDISSSNNDLTEIETKYIENSKEISSSVVVSKPDGSCNDDVNQSTEALDACERNIPLVFSRMDSPVENQTSTIPVDDYSSSPLNSWSVGEFDRIKDNVEQPSPVSVLDQFYTEDMNSPLNVDFQPGKHSSTISSAAAYWY